MTSILKVDTIQDADGNNIINESGNTITIGASGDTTNIVGTLQNNGAAVGGDNTPAFYAYATSNQTGMNHNTDYKIVFDAEEFDTDNAFDSSTNYRFTVPSGKGGKYFLYAQAPMAAYAVSKLRRVELKFYKNGSPNDAFATYTDFQSNDAQVCTQNSSGVMDLSASDYIEVYAKIRSSDSGNSNLLYSRDPYYAVFFGGFKLI